MRLIKLTINNFKGLKQFEFEPGGQCADIYGENETGKTTIADALTWLLFDKDTQGRTPLNFGIKTRDKNGAPIHDIDHAVTGVFDEISLSKVFRENWTKKRGRKEAELTGHTTDYYINDTPVKQKEYKERVNAIMSEETFKMLTIPSYVPEQLHWKERRTLLFELAGELDQEDIIGQNRELLAEYPEIVGDRSESDAVKYYSSRRRDINKRIDELPSRIDENHRSKKEAPETDEQAAREKIDQLKAERNDLNEHISELQAGGGTAKLKEQLADLDGQLSELRTKHRQQLDDQLQGLRDEVNNIQSEYDDKYAELRRIHNEYGDIKNRLANVQKVVDDHDRQIKEIEQRQPESKEQFEQHNNVCSYCGQQLPEDQVRDYQAYVEQFNNDKAEELKQYREAREGAADNLKQWEQQLQDKKQQGEKAKEELAAIEKRLTDKKKQVEDARKSQPAVEDSDEYKQIEQQKADLKQQIEQAREQVQSKVEALRGKIDEIDRDIDEYQSILNAHEHNKSVDQRIFELQNEQQQLATDLERVEHCLYVIEQYQRARASLVTERVNAQFNLVRWRLFREQVNGELEEICEPTFKGVPYSEGLNSAGRTQAGIDIINTISSHKGAEAPVFVDNREGVTTLPDTDLQIIGLHVERGTKKLRVATKEAEPKTTQTKPTEPKPDQQTGENAGSVQETFKFE